MLGSVKNKIESFAASQEDFPALLSKAKKYLIARGKLDWAEGPTAGPTPRRSDSLGKAYSITSLPSLPTQLVNLGQVNT